MNIIQTKIPDVTQRNISENKEILANSILQNVYPLFDEVYQAKKSQNTDLKKKITEGREKLGQEKETMQQLVKEYKKEQKISKILERVEKLVKAALSYDSTLKHEMVIMLKILHKLPSEKLDQQLAKTMQILNKRFS